MCVCVCGEVILPEGLSINLTWSITVEVQQRAVIAVHVTVAGVEECATPTRTHTFHMKVQARDSQSAPSVLPALLQEMKNTKSYFSFTAQGDADTRSLPRLPLVTTYPAVSPAGDLITLIRCTWVWFYLRHTCPHCPPCCLLRCCVWPPDCKCRENVS